MTDDIVSTHNGLTAGDVAVLDESDLLLGRGNGLRVDELQVQVLLQIVEVSLAGDGAGVGGVVQRYTDLNGFGRILLTGGQVLQAVVVFSRACRSTGRIAGVGALGSGILDWKLDVDFLKKMAYSYYKESSPELVQE